MPPESSDPSEIETDWRTWLYAIGGKYVRGADGRVIPLADRHEDLWQWAWDVDDGVRPPPFVAIWPRGGGKSTTAELAVVLVAAFLKRRYALYICSTQERADDHVANVAALLESKEVEEYYPWLAERAIGKFGNPKGWRRNRLRTKNGFTLDAIGLDTAARGVKLENTRPGFMVIDDVDEQGDSLTITAKKIKTLTRSILPAGTNDLAVLAVQNLVLLNGIFSRLANRAEFAADFLVDRIISGPHPAIIDPEYAEIEGKIVIVGGTPSWAGQSIDDCQGMIDTFGYSSFDSEAQHNVDAPLGGAYDHINFEQVNPSEVPPLLRISCAVDPAVTSTDQSDSNGIMIDGLGIDRRVYRLFSSEARSSPEATTERAIMRSIDMWRMYGAPVKMIFESNQGGDLWASTYNSVWKRLEEAGKIPEGVPRFRYTEVKATRDIGGKIQRGNQMLANYELGKFVHVRGALMPLETALRRWPLTKPLDLADAAYWSQDDLLKGALILGNVSQGRARGWYAETRT